MRMPTLKRRWTANDLEDLPNDGQRYEVIDGELFVTPSPSLPHQRAVWSSRACSAIMSATSAQAT